MANMNANLAKFAAAALIAAAGLTGCATQQGDPPFPSPDTATLPEGTYPNLANLAQVQPGVTKNQLYELLGPPHFHLPRADVELPVPVPRRREGRDLPVPDPVRSG
jgi:outer membrane protein assembly factor BamE (lipoprotein component of BamABCDE complex)